MAGNKGRGALPLREGTRQPHRAEEPAPARRGKRGMRQRFPGLDRHQVRPLHIRQAQRRGHTALQRPLRSRHTGLQGHTRHIQGFLREYVGRQHLRRGGPDVRPAQPLPYPAPSPRTELPERQYHTLSARRRGLLYMDRHPLQRTQLFPPSDRTYRRHPGPGAHSLFPVSRRRTSIYRYIFPGHLRPRPQERQEKIRLQGQGRKRDGRSGGWQDMGGEPFRTLPAGPRQRPDEEAQSFRGQAQGEGGLPDEGQPGPALGGSQGEPPALRGGREKPPQGSGRPGAFGCGAQPVPL